MSKIKEVFEALPPALRAMHALSEAQALVFGRAAVAHVQALTDNAEPGHVVVCQVNGITFQPETFETEHGIVTIRGVDERANPVVVTGQPSALALTFSLVQRK